MRYTPSVLSIALMLTLNVGVPSPAVSAQPASTEAAAWLRVWLGPLESDSRRLVAGLDGESASTVGAAIDARIHSPEYRTFMRRALGLFREHAGEILRHWPSYQDESVRVRDLLAHRFPSARFDIEGAVALMRDSDWALLNSEEDFQLLSRGVEKLSGSGTDLAALLDDPTLPEVLRSGFRDVMRVNVASTCLVDLTERRRRVADDLVAVLARTWKDSARAGTRMLVSLISMDHPGFAGRWGLEAHVDPGVIEAIVALRGEPNDPVLAAFAYDPDSVDRMVGYAMDARHDPDRRRGDA